MSTGFPIDAVRAQFPGLQREVGGRPAVFFDGPAGSQVPQRVADAVARHLLVHNANQGGAFATSRESDAVIERAHRAVADLLGTARPEEVAFGPNMTTLCLALGRALARTWRPGDEVVVTRLEHDANVTPWELAARDAGATVRRVAIRPGDCTLDMGSLRACLGPRTRLVAVGAASNLVGTIQPIREIATLVHAAGAELFVDAVHYAPHRRIDVAAWGCDYLVCSAYKFFGPHQGVLWGRSERLAALPAYKLRVASDALPDRWMTGTPCLEAIAGTLEAVEYLADLGRAVAGRPLDRRDALRAAFAAIEAHEGSLCRLLLDGIAGLAGVRCVGIADPARLAERTPTLGLLAEGCTPRALAEELGRRGVFTWGGNSYALPLTEALGLEPHGVLRVGLLHYNTAAEVARLIEILPQCVRAASSGARGSPPADANTERESAPD